MNKQILMTAFLSAALGVAAQAQNNTPSAASQAPTSPSASDREPLQAPRAQGYWDGDDPNLVNLVAHPFATKKYVLRHTLPIKDRLNELDEITTETGQQTKDADARAQQGLKLASEKVSMADQHSTDALNKSQLAQTAANSASERVVSAERKVGTLNEYKGTAQTEIRFRSGQTMLSKNAKNALDNMAAPLKGQKSYIIEVRGFAPGHGRTAVMNSKKMADSVVRYLLLTHRIPVYRIYAMSMGNAAVAADGAAPRRVTKGRVEVSVLESESVDTAQR